MDSVINLLVKTRSIPWSSVIFCTFPLTSLTDHYHTVSFPLASASDAVLICAAPLLSLQWRQLSVAKEGFTGASLGLLANQRRRHLLTGLLKSLRTIKTLVNSHLTLDCWNDLHGVNRDWISAIMTSWAPFLYRLNHHPLQRHARVYCSHELTLVLLSFTAKNRCSAQRDARGIVIYAAHTNAHAERQQQTCIKQAKFFSEGQPKHVKSIWLWGLLNSFCIVYRLCLYGDLDSLERHLIKCTSSIL